MMPIHDWSRVDAGIFHALHTTWIGILQTTLNEGILPPDYYALAEQDAIDVVPDVLTLHAKSGRRRPESGKSHSSGQAIAEIAPPKVRISMPLPQSVYVRKRRRLIIHHVSDYRDVAIIEIVSEGNKSSRVALEQFVNKAVEGIHHGIHFLVVDLHAPTKRDPQGIHGAICAAMGAKTYRSPPDKPLTLASYVARPVMYAYVEPVAVGDNLIPMPMFLGPGSYIYVPLEETYQQAFRGVPAPWRSTLLDKRKPKKARPSNN